MDYKDMKAFFDVSIEKNLKSIEDNFRAEYGTCFKIRRKRRDIKALYRRYQHERSKFYRYMDYNVTALDGHKVASCFIYAFLKHNLIKINRLKKRLPFELLLANEYLAVTVAFDVVAMYHCDENEGDKNFEIVVPTTKHDKKDQSGYIRYLCEALYYLRSCSRYDLFAYANILFLLEKYTELVQGEKQ